MTERLALFMPLLIVRILARGGGGEGKVQLNKQGDQEWIRKQYFPIKQREEICTVSKHVFVPLGLATPPSDLFIFKRNCFH